MKIGVADYGMNVWDGGAFDYEERWISLLNIGYDGVERLMPSSAEDALKKAATMRKLGVDFGTCLASTPEQSIQWTSALKKDYVWTNVTGKDFDTFCRQVNKQAEICEKWGISVALHNHLGSLVESQKELEDFLEKCPKSKLILDTGHLAGAGGNILEIAEKYYDRLAAVHVKDFIEVNPKSERWYEKIRFCELGSGKMGDDNAKVIQLLIKKGYNGWLFVEHDTHLREPIKDLAVSRNYIKKLGV